MLRPEKDESSPSKAPMPFDADCRGGDDVKPELLLPARGGDLTVEELPKRERMSDLPLDPEEMLEVVAGGGSCHSRSKRPPPPPVDVDAFAGAAAGDVTAALAVAADPLPLRAAG